MLVKRTPPGTPSAYLSARHLPGEWRWLLSAIDVQGSAMGTAWTDAAIVGARACFDLYERAAAD